MKSFKQFLESRPISYLDIGHNENGIAYIIRDNKIITGKSHEDPNLKNSPPPWGGRFEPDTNRITVAPPVSGTFEPTLFKGKRIPPNIKLILQKKFGKDIVFYPMGGLR